MLRGPGFDSPEARARARGYSAAEPIPISASSSSSSIVSASLVLAHGAEPSWQFASSRPRKE